MRTHKPECKVIIAPTAVYLSDLNRTFFDSPVYLASQDVSSELEGAYTGEVSVRQLSSIGIEYCIIGHSERRKYHEDNEFIVAQKLNLLFQNKMRPILCVGERLQERKDGVHKELVKDQVLSAIKGQSEENLKQLIIAYEPVWAIGTGETATPDQAQEMHAFIRAEVAKAVSEEVAQAIRILYGGSVKVGNARELFDQPDVDGGLVGGASLEYNDFKLIINACG